MELVGYTPFHQLQFDKNKSELMVTKHHACASDSKFTDQELTALLKALQVRNVARLVFQCNVMATTDVQTVAKHLREGKSPGLTFIDFCFNRDFRASALVEVLEARNLQRLELPCCRRIGSEFPILANALSTSCLTKIALFDSGLECDGVHALIDA
jgi:hypothetical protein